jgi:phenylacetate-coenzyme A ligase PaaK-like adenylate-forming protein
MYGCTEVGAIAIKSWNKKKDMTFIPYFSFFEFVPEEEWLRSREDKSYQPATILMNQVEKGKRYELIITNFYGMPLLRYRLGDLIKIVDLQDEETGIKIPQMSFESRADDLIDIGGFTRLDEKTVWQAIANTNIKYEDWTIRKEYESARPVLRLYLEPREEIDRDETESRIHGELVAIDQDYGHLVSMLEARPLKITLLPEGTFRRYYEEKRKSGADLSHLKPPHMSVSDQTIEELLSVAKGGG